MGNREDLQIIFENILGSRNVYFQPPESVKMKYPAIVYKRNDIQTIKADDKLYKTTRRYSVSLIDPSPESVFIDEILKLPYCSFDRHYTSDNLNHDVFDLYF